MQTHARIAIEFIQDPLIKEPWKSREDFERTYGLQYSHTSMSTAFDKVYKVFIIEDQTLCSNLLEKHSNLIASYEYGNIVDGAILGPRSVTKITIN